MSCFDIWLIFLKKKIFHAIWINYFKLSYWSPALKNSFFVAMPRVLWKNISQTKWTKLSFSSREVWHEGKHSEAAVNHTCMREWEQPTPPPAPVYQLMNQAPLWDNEPWLQDELQEIYAVSWSLSPCHQENGPCSSVTYGHIWYTNSVSFLSYQVHLWCVCMFKLCNCAPC